MADDTGVQISITADASGVAPGVEAAKNELAGLDAIVKRMTAEFAAMTSAMAEGLAEMRKSAETTAQDLNQMSGAVRSNIDGSAALASAAGATAEKIAEGSAGAKEATKTFSALEHGTAGITREMLVLGRELANGNFTRMSGSAMILTQRLGFLTPEVIATGAAIAAIAAPIAIFIAAYESGSTEVAKFKNSMEAMNGYAGVTISQIQNMSRQLATLADTSIGKARDEMYALAASGKFTGDSLALVGFDATRMAQLTGESADKFNTYFEGMRQNVAKFAEEYQERYHQLTAAQIEYIRQLAEQGRDEEAEHQLAKDIYEYLGTQAPENLGYLENAWRGVASAISEAWDYLKSFGRDSAQDKIDQINQKISDLRGPIGNFSPDATGEIADLERQKKLIEDQEAARQRAAAAQAEEARAQTDGAAAAARLHSEFEASRTSGEKLAATIRQINEDLAKAISADPGHRSQLEAEAAAAREQAEKSFTPREPKPKAEKPRTGDWEEALEAQKTAFAMEQQEQGTFEQWSLASDAAYWEKLLAQGDLSSKERLAVEQKFLAAVKASNEQKLSAIETDAKRELNAAGQNHDAKIAILKNEAAEVAKLFGEESPQYQAVQDRITAEARSAANERMEIARIEAEAKIKLAQGELGAADQLAKFRVEMGVETNAQLLAQERTFLQQNWQLQEQAYQQAIAAAAGNTVEQERLRKQQEVAEQAHQAKMTAIDQQATLQRTQIERTAITGISQDFARSLSQMMTLQKSFAQDIQSLWQGLTNTIGNALASIIEQWLEKQLAAIFLGKAAQTASSKSTIAGLAAQAGAAGVASMAAAPFPLDLGAPEFGASMAAAAGSFSIASAAGGWDNVPFDGAMTELHRNEMVLPASIAAPLRSMIATGGINDNVTSGALGGGHTFNFNLHSPDSDGIQRMLTSETGQNAIIKSLSKAVSGLKTN